MSRQEMYENLCKNTILRLQSLQRKKLKKCEK